MNNADELMKITREACAMSHEKLPENDYIVSVFQEIGGGKLSQSFRGRMESRSLIALVNAAISELAEQIGKTREYVFDTLKNSGDSAAKVVDYRRQNRKESPDE